MTLHSFERELAASSSATLRARLDGVYRQLFPAAAVVAVIHDDSGVFQTSGRDVRIQLRAPRGMPFSASLVETLEEKIRSEEASTYPDILIEYLSNEEHGTLGWVYTSRADWLAYVRQPLGELDVLILPMQQLRAWFTPRATNYPDVRAKTRLNYELSYTTVNKAVPFKDQSFLAFWHANGCQRFVAPPP